MVTAEFLKTHQFKTIQDFFKYIAKHLGNQAYEDAQKQFNHLSHSQRIEFAQWVAERDYFEGLKYRAAMMVVNSIPKSENDTPKVIVEVKDGGVTKVYHNSPNIETIVLDYDIDDIDDLHLSDVKFPGEDITQTLIKPETPIQLNNEDFTFVWNQLDFKHREPLTVVFSNDDKDLADLYNQAGQCIERDFESACQAERWAIENGYCIVELFP